MFGLFSKEIKGRVTDEHASSQQKGFQKSLEGIAIKLYRVTKAAGRNRGYRSNNIDIFNKRLVNEATTDKNGQFAFHVMEGCYEVHLDINTLPQGKGVISKDLLIKTGEKKNIDFKVRNIARIEIPNELNRDLFIGDEIILNPVFKDTNGDMLFAKTVLTSESDDIEIENSRLKMNYRGLNPRVVYINIHAGQVSKRMKLDLKAPDVSSIHKIRRAYHLGVIDEGEKIQFYLYLLFNNKLTDRRGRPIVPVKSGTTAIKEIHDYIRKNDADKGIVQEAERLLSFFVPKLNRVYKSKSGFFNIHYTVEGANAVPIHDTDKSGVPDYIEYVGTCLDHVKEVTCSIRGFRTPILDKENTFMDVHVFDLDKKYGVTVPITYYRDKAGKRKASCYLCLDNNYAPEKQFKKSASDCIKVTAAHEYFHAVQYAYNVDADTWWKEASATWNEDEIYDEVNDYFQYLDSVFKYPEKSLEESSYGGVAFAKYLSEKFGGYRIIKSIWNTQGNKHDSSFNAIDATIRESLRYENISTVYNGYTAWNYNPSQYYREGSKWEQQIQLKDSYTSYPIALQSGKLDHFAACYELFKPVDTQGNKTIRINVEGSSKMKWGFKILRRRNSDGICEIIEVETDGSNNKAEVICRDFGDIYKEVCFVPANLEKEMDGKTYSYSVNIE